MNFGDNSVTVSGSGRSLTNSGTQSITFGGTLDGDSSAGDDAITINSGSGGVTFANNVGSTDSLETLTVDSDGSTAARCSRSSVARASAGAPCRSCASAK